MEQSLQTRHVSEVPTAGPLGRAVDRAIDVIVGSRHVMPTSVKVPLQITALFWAIKIVSTCMGESLADWLDGSADIALAVAGTLLALAALVVALRMQFRTESYTTAVYWFAVAMVATFGTMAADAPHQFLGAPYWSTTAFYALILAVIFWRWQASEGTLSIHSILTRRREKFYWATVLATFALGTAAGDWTAGDLHLNFLPSGVLFAVIIVVPAIGYRLGANPIGMFWFAYVITRPLGASFADWFDYPTRNHGLGIAHPIVWGTLGALMVVLVSVLAVTERRAVGALASGPDPGRGPGAA